MIAASQVARSSSTPTAAAVVTVAARSAARIHRRLIAALRIWRVTSRRTSSLPNSRVAAKCSWRTRSASRNQCQCSLIRKARARSPMRFSRSSCAIISNSRLTASSTCSSCARRFTRRLQATVTSAARQVKRAKAHLPGKRLTLRQRCGKRPRSRRRLRRAVFAVLIAVLIASRFAVRYARPSRASREQ